MTATFLTEGASMNPLNWFPPAIMHSLGWALLHFVWQGTALAALAAGVMAVCRRPSARYLAGVAALVLMLLSPVATVFFCAQQPPTVVETGKSSPLPAFAWPMTTGKTAASGSMLPAYVAASRDRLAWLVEAWLIGVAFFSLRSAGGFVLLARERRKQSGAVQERVLEICYGLEERLGIRRAIQYCQCKWLQAPAVVGWFRPIVFLPASALTGLSEEQLRAVIAHELAHIRRFDSFVNVFQVCVETLLFYHPAVWWLNKRICAEREHCCDETAVTLCGNAVEYARALTLMEQWRSAPVFAMAANRGPLTERIMRVLGLKTLGAGMRGLGIAGSLLCVAAALGAGGALLGIARPATAQAGFLFHAASGSGVAQQPAAPRMPAPKPSAAQSATPAASPARSTNAAPTGSSYIDAMKAAGLPDLSIDDLIALKSQNVTPQYVREIHDLGLHPDADGLVGLKVQGVTPEYIKGLRSLGFDPNEDQIIGMKVQGITPDYVQGLKEAGIQANADEIIGMKVQGVTPDYIRELRALGLNVNADDVVGLKVQGVMPAYVKGLQDQGLHPSADDVVGMRVQGVTPEYIRDIRALGLSPSADELVGMRVQGVTPEYIKYLQSAGFKPSVDDIIGAKVQGLTPEFIDEARKHGFKNLTLEKLIELKHLGILDSGKGEL
jgi:beta-lactamase regulating signal transducer with metallopeptidase domain